MPIKNTRQTALILTITCAFILIMSGYACTTSNSAAATTRKLIGGTSTPAIVLMPTETPFQPTISAVQRVTETATSQVTATPSSEALLDETLKGRDLYSSLAFLFTGADEKRILALYTPKGDLIKKIDFGEYPWTLIGLQEVDEACTLLLQVNTQEDLRLIHFNVKTGDTQEMFSNQGKVNGTWKTWPQTSLNQKYLSYVVWSGDFYYDSSQYQDVEVISNQPGQKAVRLTRHGGAWKTGGEWSPEGNRIAYSDYDANGNQQLMVTQMDSLKKTVLTNFKGPEIRIAQIAWSPDGNQIIFVVLHHYRNEEVAQTAELWMANLQDQTQTQFPFPKNPDSITLVSWSSDGNRAFIAFTSEDGNYLAWLDIQKRNFSQNIETANHESRVLNNLTFSFPVSLDQDVIGFESMGNIYFLDADAQSPIKVDRIETGDIGTLTGIHPFQQIGSNCN